ncbi:MAG: hypothetical protein JXA98_07515 [Methanosarcinaceae archaeon]|nr:hypothetical protein [Methanosarcinaceae archaeon]
MTKMEKTHPMKYVHVVGLNMVLMIRAEDVLTKNIVINGLKKEWNGFVLIKNQIIGMLRDSFATLPSD